MSEERAMRRIQRREASDGERGFALILAMLCLMVLTMLGMTLATTTSSELQIATNYRWSQQAYYNAEAGIDLGKRYLRQLEWTSLLGTPRNTAVEMAPDSPLGIPSWTMQRNGAAGEDSRNWENAACDTGARGGNIGFGHVFDHPTFAAPLQNTSTFLGQTLNGTFTLWVRRKLELDATNNWVETTEDRVILTSEGTAPFLGATGLRNRSVRFLEVELTRTDPADCENYTGQEGMGPTGSNYDPCATITDEGLVGATGGGAVVEVDPAVQ